MAYTSGDTLKFTGISGNYRIIVIDIPTTSKTITFTFIACTDVDNNNYPTVQIGSQIWMAENLKTTKYNDGTSIPLATNETSWINLSTPGYCWYNNDEATYKATFGALYNWYTIDTNIFCPTGWHVSTHAEWITLYNYLIANGYNYDGTTTEDKIAKALASTSGWISSTNTGSVGNTDYPAKRNATGFSAFPRGYRTYNGGFSGVGDWGMWWLATEYSSTQGWVWFMVNSDAFVDFGGTNKKNGLSVRCLRDN
jgi:uncharacterized protein (TIGR02145 family)